MESETNIEHDSSASNSDESKVKSKKSTKKRLSNKIRPRKNKKLTLSKLNKYKGILKALARAQPEDQIQIMEHMPSAQFNTVCECVHDFTHNDKLIESYLNDDERTDLSKSIESWKNPLRKVLNPKCSTKARRKMIHKKQKGGSVSLGNILTSLLPMAMSAVETLI